jgi:hypothetical protein
VSISVCHNRQTQDEKKNRTKRRRKNGEKQKQQSQPQDGKKTRHELTKQKIKKD